jgi:pimeloyl-ACP methyl ester carboxylesterase
LEPASPIFRTGDTFATEVDSHNPVIYTFSEKGSGFKRLLDPTTPVQVTQGDLAAAGGRILFHGGHPVGDVDYATVWSVRTDGNDLRQLVPDNKAYIGFWDPLVWEGVWPTGTGITGMLQVSPGTSPGPYDLRAYTATSDISVPPPPKSTVIFVQGIGSDSACPDSPGFVHGSSSDFAGRLSWLKAGIARRLNTDDSFLYYGYTSPRTSNSKCTATRIPHYKRVDSCWSLDDTYQQRFRTRAVPGGGEAARLAAYLHFVLAANPAATVSLVTHSQGGVLAAYTVKEKLTVADAKRIRAIVTLDSPLRGINSVAPRPLKWVSGCAGDARLDSTFDMEPTSAVIARINDGTTPQPKLYTVDANPGALLELGGFPLIDNLHSTTWWATAHIRVKAGTHSDIWDGGVLTSPQRRKLFDFAGCAVGGLAADCRAYARP